LSSTIYTKCHAITLSPKAIKYEGKPDFFGTDTLTFIVKDQGKKLEVDHPVIVYPPGALDVQVAQEFIDIAVNPINDNPIIGENLQLSKPEAVLLIESWLQAKKRGFGNQYDSGAIYQYATGKLLTDSLGSLQWLRDNNAYYYYGEFKVEPITDVVVNDNQATITASISENPTLYINGRFDPSKSGFSSKNYQFALEFDGSSWKIADYEEL
jgi:serine/threonine-protein kinase